jgi:hypothetical protein
VVPVHLLPWPWSFRLAIAFNVLRRLDMTRRSRSLSKEELDFVEFLDAEVTSLSSSLAYEASIAELPLPTSVACQIVDLQSDPAVVDAPVAIAPIVIVGLLNPPPPYGGLVSPDYRCRGVIQGKAA